MIYNTYPAPNKLRKEEGDNLRHKYLQDQQDGDNKIHPSERTKVTKEKQNPNTGRVRTERRGDDTRPPP
jgi:hypothetical protein